MKNAIKIFLTFAMEMKRKSFHGILENLFAMSGSIISTLVFNNVDLKLRIHHFIYSVEILLRFCFWTSSVPDPSRGHSFFFFQTHWRLATNYKKWSLFFFTLINRSHALISTLLLPCRLFAVPRCQHFRGTVVGAQCRVTLLLPERHFFGTRKPKLFCVPR